MGKGKGKGIQNQMQLQAVLLGTTLSKKIYPQNSSRASSMKKYIEDGQTPEKMIGKQDETEEHRNDRGSKWVKTDSEYIVLEI